jgi:hypothetical protein
MDTEKRKCPAPLGFRPRTAQPAASRYTGPLLVSQWYTNYGVTEAPTSYLRLSKVCGLPLRIAYDICKLSTTVDKPNQTKQPSAQGYNRVCSHVICSESTTLRLQSLFPETQEEPYSLSPTPRSTLTQNIKTDFEDYKNCGATSILGGDGSKQSSLSYLKRRNKSKTTS